MKTKQALIVLSILFWSLGVGFALGVSPIMIQAIITNGINDDGEREDMASASFLYMSKLLASGMGFLIMAIVMQILGRKIAHIVNNVLLIISIILLLAAKHIKIIHLAQVIQGISDTGILLQAIILSEYCHKKRRGIYMCLEKFAESVGIFLSVMLSKWMSWRYICIVGLVPPCLAIALTIFWPESPYFHAMNAEYEECEKTFKLLHGESAKRRGELITMIKVQQKKLERKNRQRGSMIANTLRKFLDKSFWNMFTVMTVLIILCVVKYSSYFFTELFLLHRGHYNGVTFLNISTLLASLISCAIILIERRTVLLVFGFVSILLMFLASLLASSSDERVQLVTCILISFHNFFFDISIVPVCSILFGELYFLEHRGIGMFSSGIVLVAMKLISVMTPYLVQEVSGYVCLFLNIAWVTVLCLVFLFFLLPETKDKTLEEIELEFRGERVVPDSSEQVVEMGQLLNNDGQEVNL